jgi:hypothetical protein
VAVGAAVTAPEAHCRCAVHPDHPCGNAITQEDLLCDCCRSPMLGVDPAPDDGLVVLRTCSVTIINGVACAGHRESLEFRDDLKVVLGLV